MAIKFVCSCGKHLRARDEMATRRSMCPRCGAPVGIPSLQPTYPGTTLGPLSPLERQRTRRRVPVPEVADRTTDPPRQRADGSRRAYPPPAVGEATSGGRRLETDLVRLGARERQGRRSQLETHWYQCLLYPVRAWPLVLGLALALPTLSGLAVLAWPDMLDLSRHPEVFWEMILCLSCGAVLLVSYACGFLACVVDSATAGETRHIRWPGRNVGLALKSGAAALVCFLAGPVVPAGTAFFYWLYGGELALLDRLILAELGILAVSYWLFALLAVSKSGRLIDANPVRVAEYVHRLGYRAVAAGLAASLLVLTHGWLAFTALEELHTRAVLGWLLLFVCWLSGMFWATFLLRLLGVWCHRSRL